MQTHMTPYTRMYKHTLANFSPSTQPQTLKVNNVGHGPSLNYRHFHHHLHLQTPSLLPAVRPRGTDPVLAMHSQAWVLACGPPNITFWLWSLSQDAVGRASRWRKFQSLTLLSSPRNSLDGYQVPNNSLILPSSSSLALSSYFTSHMWENPASLTQNPCLYRTCSLLLALWCLWSILSNSICAKWK